MNQLFKKAAVFGDLHMGKRSDSAVHNQDCLTFIEWFCTKAKAAKVDRIIFVGDWFDNPSRLRTDTSNFSNDAMRMLLEVAPVDMLTGNHDMYNRANRDIISIDHFSDWDGVTVYNDMEVVGQVGFVPYLVGSEYLQAIDMKAKYIFGHFALPNFLMNSKVEMKDSGQFNSDQMVHPEYIFSGHFHKRQLKLNKSKIPVWYIGNPFGHTFNDVGDRERGMMILEWDQEPQFIDWEDGPIYQRFSTSEILDLLETDGIRQVTRPTSILEIKDDIGLDLEDIGFIREQLNDIVREARVYDSSALSVSEEQEITDMDDKTLDQVVVSHLEQVDPHGSDIDPQYLIKLFKGTI
jgi:DNA repair exonuclease SbcCD nuclease subunit